MKTLPALMLSCLAACSACNAPATDDLSDGELVLPRELREVSAIVAIDERTLACLQDEAGRLFFVDLMGERPTRVAVFAEPGDYEGLALVGDQFWVLRSDGVLLQLQSKGAAFEVAAKFQLPGQLEWEALCYDIDRKVLLTTPKHAQRKEDRDRQLVYAIDPATGAVQKEPVLVLDRATIIDQAAVRGIELPTRKGGKGKTQVDLRLVFSEILAAPGSDRLLLLSAVDRTVLEVDREGRLLGATLLKESRLPQPEGMAWLRDGRLLVASEGVEGRGVVRVVRR